jgi:hypothetical protein
VRPVGARGANAGEETADAAGGLEASAQVLAPDVPDLVGEGGGGIKARVRPFLDSLDTITALNLRI